MKKKYIFAMLLFAVAILATPLSAKDRNTYRERETDAAFEGGKEHLVHACRGTLRLLRSLNLSDVQKRLVKAALTSFYRDVSASAEERARAWKALFLVVHTPLEPQETFDEQAVREAWQTLSALKEDVIVRYAELVVQLQRILNHEQYRKFVRSRLYFVRCSNAPAHILRRVLHAWITD